MRMCSLALIAVLIVTSAPLWPQIHDRDPLTDAEVDQLRETAIEPEKRLKLMVEFTKARMTSLEQERTDPKAKDRGKRMHDLLEDISTLVDEIDDNVDDYNERSADLRKPLKQVVEMDKIGRASCRERV